MQKSSEEPNKIHACRMLLMFILMVIMVNLIMGARSRFICFKFKEKFIEKMVHLAALTNDRLFKEHMKASNDVGSIMYDSDSEEVSNIFVEYNGKHVDDLVDYARKKVGGSSQEGSQENWDDYMGHATNIVEHEN
nr:hypothetical protein [Tanacetum cinerariifolium]